MQIDERSAGDVTVLDLKGRMTMGEGDELLKDKVNSLILQGRKKLVLNLADVPYVDSAGLGQLVQAYSTAKNHGATLKLLEPTPRLRDLLVVTTLSTIFEIYDDEAAVLASYGVQPA